MKQAALVAGKGFCMGTADIVPGVSGGTMALILGIYPRLLGAIRAVDLALFRLVGRGRLSAAARHVTRSSCSRSESESRARWCSSPGWSGCPN